MLSAKEIVLPAFSDTDWCVVAFLGFSLIAALGFYKYPPARQPYPDCTRQWGQSTDDAEFPDKNGCYPQKK